MRSLQTRYLQEIRSIQTGLGTSYLWTPLSSSRRQAINNNNNNNNGTGTIRCI
jgi:hypothetical protein